MPTIAAIKEEIILDTPLVLFECILADSTTERWSTHSVSVAGTAYEGRVLSHNMFELMSGPEISVDVNQRLCLFLANADSYFSQLSRQKQWKGAQVTALLVFFDLPQGEVVSESMVLFKGTAGQPEEITERTFRITITSRLNSQRFLLPDTRIQRRCPWPFPATPEQRQLAMDGGARGRYSPFYRCGYSADQAGGVGNLNGTEPFSSCNYTRQQCIDRGMFSVDNRGNATRRFGGIEYVPASTLVRGRGDAGFSASTILDNQARYNDFVPLVYGTAWVTPPVVTAKNDGNLTRLEVLLGLGEINRVVKVLVNDAEIPAGVAGASMTATGWYNVVSRGTREGGFNLDFTGPSGDPLGDPYGSMAYLSVVVPNRVTDAKTVPRISALVDGLTLPRYAHDGSSLAPQFSNNPAWVLLDLLFRSGWAPSEIDLGSFAKAADFCEETVPASDLYGNAVAIPRFGCNLVVRRRHSAADLIRGVRASAGLYLCYTPSGQLEARVEESLAKQQPTKAAGSNALSMIQNGWPAYEFGDGTQNLSGILRRENGAASIRLWYRTTVDSPNRYSIEFQDEFNDYQQDSLSIVDIEDAIAAGQETSATLPALGVPNFHQAARLLRRQLDKTLRGNLCIEFETSVRAAGIRAGDIITITYMKEGLIRQPFRVTQVAFGLNCATARIDAHYHDDAWYRDTTEEGGGVSRRQSNSNGGIPRPLLGTRIEGAGETVFDITEEHEVEADGTVTIMIKAGFTAPEKPGVSAAAVPQLSLAVSIDVVGGTLAGGTTYYYAVSAIDSEDVESPLSFTVPASTPPGTNSNRVALENLRFSAATQACNVYRGVTPNRLLRIRHAMAPSATFWDDGFPYAIVGPPDENYHHARFEWRFEIQPAVQATSYSPSSIGSDSLHLLENEWIGKIVRISEGAGSGQERVIASHDASVLTVSEEWEIAPDSTSKFLIADGTWTLAATGVTSPVTFRVPNRVGATVHVVGQAVSARGIESGRELSPLTRWTIEGFGGSGGDVTAPPAPVFGIAPSGQGTVEIVGIGFTDLANTRTAQAATLMLHYWDELQGTPATALSQGIDASTTEIYIAGGSTSAGNLLQIDSEIVEVESQNGLLTVRRGSHSTSSVAHAIGSKVYRLDRKSYVIPFAKSFFGSPASGSFSYSIRLPNARIGCAEMFMTNSLGNGESTKLSFTGTSDRGIRTLTGGQFTFQCQGHLAIKSGAAPAVIVDQARAIRDIFAVVSEAASGVPINLALRVDDQLLCQLTIAAGQTASEVVDGFGLPPLPALSRLSLDIVSVGNDGTATPGRDLTVTIRL